MFPSFDVMADSRYRGSLSGRADRLIIMGLWAILATTVLGQSPPGTDVIVQVSATVQKAPPKITLTWPNAPSSGIGYSNYTIYRKSALDTSWGTPLAQLSGASGSYGDTSVSVGAGYEYQIVRGTTNGFLGYGYIYAGIEVPAVENRGKLILLVDSTKSTALQSELARLQDDLVGDGWVVLRHDLAPTLKDSEVKAVIRADFNADPANVQGLFLFGHIPVPYSGKQGPRLPVQPRALQYDPPPLPPRR